MDNQEIWRNCLTRLESEVNSQDFYMWLHPITAENHPQYFLLTTPNKYVQEWVISNVLEKIQLLVKSFCPDNREVRIKIDQNSPFVDHSPNNDKKEAIDKPINVNAFNTNVLNPNFTFEKHVEGKSNQVARAASRQVGENPGGAYNPLFIYGGVGLGKTHLMQAAGNLIKHNNSNARVVYVHSERFVNDMVKSIASNKMEQFKQYYRSLDALLIDDIQFFAGKNQSQEEFFHTFNTLLESNSQIILTSDKFPKEINNLQERLISRFESGLTMRIDPPELETRVAILKNKAQQSNIDLDDKVAFFVAEKVRSNVRELEGALNRLIASSGFINQDIDLALAKDILQDLSLFQERKISIENIQKVVSEYYSIRVSDLKSKRRSRQIARPRQIAMALAKELTNLSLPDIGDAFGGKDHSTVIHACKKVNELIKIDSKINDDYRHLMKLLSV